MSRYLVRDNLTTTEIYTNCKLKLDVKYIDSGLNYFSVLVKRHFKSCTKHCIYADMHMQTSARTRYKRA